jgi:hypothetical protein
MSRRAKEFFGTLLADLVIFKNKILTQVFWEDCSKKMQRC